jgi:phosphoenolpyruvate carboxylase
MGVDTIIADIENKLYRSVFYSQGEIFINLEELKDKLLQVKMLAAQHQSLYIDEIDLLLNKNKLWISFATLDIRQK